MKIVRLTAENFKRLKAVEITPEGDTVVIAGRNAQGKSSVLDAIWAALGGAAASKPTTRPIRDGETKASVVLDLGDLLVERRWTAKSSTLTVTNTVERSKHSSPQQLLDSLVGRLSFDPLAFAQMPAKEQRATLIALADMPFDVAEADARRARTYEERTFVNRDVKSLEARILQLPAISPGVPDQPVDVAQLAKALSGWRDHTAELDRMRIQAEDLQGEIDALTQRRTALVDKARAMIAAAGQVPDLDAMQQQLEGANTINAQVARKVERKVLTDELRVAKGRADEMTAEIQAIDKAKADALARANLPVAGLAFDDEGVTYNGVPFAQASAAERLRVSVAMAMAMNPNVRVIRIMDGSLLDSDNLRLISEMAAAHDFQVWIERVDETGQVGVVIEDGEVKA